MIRARSFAVVFILLGVAGTALAADSPVAVSPGDASKLALIESCCPTFSWGVVQGAESYELVVYWLIEEIEDGEEAREALRQRFPGSVASWTPALPACLERGARYAWSIRALTGEAVSDWSTPNLFEIAPEPSSTDLEAAVELILSHIGSGRDTVSSREELLEALAAPRREAAETNVSKSLPAGVGTTQMTVDGGVVAASFTGDGSTLTSLDPKNLSTGTADIDISGTAAAATSATTAVSATSATTADSATTATSLASDGTNCPAGQFPSGVDEAGNAQGCAHSHGARNQSGRIDFEVFFADPLPFADTFSPGFVSPPTLQLTPLFPVGGASANLTGLSTAGFSGVLVHDAPTVVADSQYNVGQYSSLAVVNGKPAIAYHDTSQSDLKYVQAMDSDGTAWRTPVAVDAPVGTSPGVGWYASLAVVNGRPAISYWDFSNNDLKYVWATDSDGTAWGTPVTVDDSGGAHGSLAVVNGKPAIGYTTGSGIFFVQANDSDGASWGTPVVAGALPGPFVSLAVVNGKPAMSYQLGAFYRDLYYVQATDADGTAWSTPVPVDAPVSAPEVGEYSSLAVVNGKPAISYYDYTNGDLKYVQAADADGTAWGTPVAVEAPAGTTPDVGSFSSLAVVDGKPAISYYDATNNDLKFIQATDADGMTWGTPLVVDASPDSAGGYTSLSVVNGKPAISYYDFTNDDLKYWRPVDAAVLWTAIEP